MRISDEQELKNMLRNDTIGGFYLIFGEESFLKQHYADLIARKAVKKNQEGFNLHTFEGKNTAIDEIAEAVEAVPVFSEKSCVLIKDFPVNDLEAADFEKLMAILVDVPEYCALILLMDYIEIKKKKTDLNETEKKKNYWNPVLKIAEEKGYAIELNKQKLPYLIKLIESGANRRGCNIDYNTAKYLVSVIGDDIHTLQNELDKVCAHSKDKTLTKEDVDSVAIKTVEAKAFDIAKAIISNDFEQAYKTIDTLLNQKEEPVKIMAAVNSSFVDMYRVKAALLAGELPANLSEYFTEYGNSNFRLKEASRYVSNIQVNRLRNCLEILNETDERLKSSMIDKRFDIEQTAVKLLLAINES